MIIYTSASQADLPRILDLQQINLPGALTLEEIKKQGFVTLEHSLSQLEALQQIERHVVAKERETLIGYILAMTADSRGIVTDLERLFEQFEHVEYQQKTINSYHYLLIGQVCVAKAHRGRGVFDQCYAYYQSIYASKYDFAITAISVNNHRSLNAHRRIGFQKIHYYKGGDQKDWWIVIWNWNRPDSQ